MKDRPMKKGAGRHGEQRDERPDRRKVGPGTARGKDPVRQKDEKTAWKPGNVLSPAPALLVSCGGTPAWKPNLITIAWAGNVCSDPPMVSISVRPERYSYGILMAEQEFVVNVPSLQQTRAVDWCGVVSGRDVDKFAGAGLTPAPALKVRPPIVRECPLNIECRVRKTLPLGTHTLFLAEVVAVQVTEFLIDAKGRLCLERSGILAFAHGQYFALGRHLASFGFSVRKRPPRSGR
jgi:flavin reductase (DIM6/NTAB) family NADH-FMN oxidoreductase RutF